MIINVCDQIKTEKIKMSLKFLSKKKWHVRRLENIRKVAQAEAKQAEEQTRMAELRREREEEREMEAIRRIQEASGQIPVQQRRLEFLYKEPPVPKKNEEEVVTTEEVLRPSNLERNEMCLRQQVPGVKWLSENKKNKGDEEVRSREDPITAIKAKRERDKQEAEERRALLEKLKSEDRKRHHKRKHRHS